jgi:hypothetical protein
MEIKFDSLLAYSIKRLSRPKFKHDAVQFNDPIEFQSFDQEPYLPTKKSVEINSYDINTPQTEEQRMD